MDPQPPPTTCYSVYPYLPDDLSWCEYVKIYPRGTERPFRDEGYCNLRKTISFQKLYHSIATQF